MKDQPPIAQPLWDGMPAEAQAAVSELVDSYRRRIAELEQRLILLANSAGFYPAWANRANREVRVFARGVSASHAANRDRFIAAAVITCWRWALPSPI
jgi:hypothetical protein